MRRVLPFATAIVAASLCRPIPAAADTILLAAGGGASTDGPLARGEVAARWHVVTGTVRLDAAGAGDSVLVTALAGVGPRQVTRRAVATRWHGDCVTALRAAGSTRRCAAGAADRRVAREARALGWLGGVAGVRQGARTEALAALRVHPTDDVLGDVVELGLSAVVAGRDRLYVQHARFAPGWYARAQLRLWHVSIAGEVGMTGLASRDDAGRFRAETFASATVGVGVVL